MKKIICYLLIVFIFNSCSIATHYVQSGSTTYPVTKDSNILIYSNTCDKQFDIIGNVAVLAALGDEQAVKVLKKKAAELGADAIIEVKLDKISSYNQSCGISGIAIKFK